MIAYDHRGVGASTPPGRARSRSREMAEDAAALLDALELDSAHVMGISMGGMIAQELALGHAERVRTLTLGCTYCGGEGSALASEAVMQQARRRRWPRATASVRCAPGGRSTSRAAMAADDEAYASVPRDRRPSAPSRCR